MTYKTKYMLGTRFIAIVFTGLFVVIPVGMIFFLNTDNYGVIGAVMPVPTLLITFILAFAVSYVTNTINVTEQVLRVNKLQIPFADITSYYIRNETPKLCAVDIALKTGKEVTIYGRNFGPYGDQMKAFITHLQERFNATGSLVKEAESARALKLKVYKKRWAVVIKACALLVLLTDVFVVVMYLTGQAHKFPFYSLLSINLMVPYLLAYLPKLKE